MGCLVGGLHATLENPVMMPYMCCINSRNSWTNAAHRDMGAWYRKVKGIGLMILEFWYQLFAVVQPRRRRVFFGLVTILFAGAAIPLIPKQIIEPL